MDVEILTYNKEIEEFGFGLIKTHKIESDSFKLMFGTVADDIVLNLFRLRITFDYVRSGGIINHKT